jgi:hypothetical protein
MSNTVVYIVVTVSLLHLVAGIVFLLRKLSGPPPKDETSDSSQ